MRRRVWQDWETRVARRFGCRRSALSGGGNVGTLSDSTHPRLFASVKTSGKKSMSVRRWEEAADQAKREGKIPFVAECIPGEPGGHFFVIVRDDHLPALAAEWRDTTVPKVGGVIGEPNV